MSEGDVSDVLVVLRTSVQPRMSNQDLWELQGIG